MTINNRYVICRVQHKISGGAGEHSSFLVFGRGQTRGKWIDIQNEQGGTKEKHQSPNVEALEISGGGGKTLKY